MCLVILPPHVMVKSAVSSFRASLVSLVFGLDGLRGTGFAHSVRTASLCCGGVVGSTFAEMGKHLKIFIVAEIGKWDGAC